jgi:flagellar hook assembly protein FlgD
VVNEEELGVTHLLNYPNPFTTHTEFFFEHNQCCSALEVRIEIFTVSGKLVKTIFDNVNTIAFRSEGIAWDGRDDFGDKLARGVYIYRLTVKTPEGLKAEKIEKLVIL